MNHSYQFGICNVLFRRAYGWCFLLSLICGLDAAQAKPGEAKKAATTYPAPAAPYQKFNNPPLLFSENLGQISDNNSNPRTDILFSAHSGGAKVFLTACGIHYQFEKTTFPEGYERDERKVKDPRQHEELAKQIKAETYRFSLLLEGANTSPRVIKEGRNEYFENFYLAHCPVGIIGVHNYSRIIMEEVYPGIDWIVYGNDNRLKYDFIVRPGADPSRIRLKVSDATGVSIADNGELLMKTSLGEVREAAPIAQQGGIPIAVSFKKQEDGNIGFMLGEWDKTKTLIIDPSVNWATYYGDGGDDLSSSCATDRLGNVYMAGSTNSSVSIASSGGYQTTFGGSRWDAFLVKFDSSGRRLWATYYGGRADDQGSCCVADAGGNVYMTGYTNSDTAIATVGAFQPAISPFSSDAFLSKFSSSGKRLWATYYGGSKVEGGSACVTDRQGNVYMTGTTGSTAGIASPGAYQTTYGGGRYVGDAFLVKFDSSGNRKWGTYFGDYGDDYAYGSAIDSLGNAYISGHTTSLNNIASPGAYQTTLVSTQNAYLAKFDSGGNRLWSTYYGGKGELGYSCATDRRNNVYLVGYTGSTTGIATSGAYQTALTGGFQNGFLVKFTSTGSRLWATYYGTGGSEGAEGCTTDRWNNVYMAGSTGSATGIASADGYQTTYGGGLFDAYFVMFDSSGGRKWATYIGGSGVDYGYGCAASDTGNIFLAGTTTSATRIATPGAYQTVYGGQGEAYLIKFHTVSRIDTTKDSTSTGIAVRSANWPGNISILPNPVAGHFALVTDWDAAHSGQRTYLDITNTLGQSVYHTQIKPDRAKLSYEVWLPDGLANGQYMLHITTEDQMQSVLKFTLMR